MNTKKISGWFITILCSVFLLITIGGLMYMVWIFLDDSTAEKSFNDIIESFAGFIITISALIFGLKEGIKRIKKNRIKKIVEYNGTLDIIFKSKISYRDYRNLIMGLSLKRPTYLLLVVIAILSLLSILCTNNLHLSDTVWIPFVIFTMIILVPLLVLYQTKKTFQTNKIFKEEIQYKFDNQSVEAKGETFNSIVSWSHFIKIKETKTFFLLYQDNIIAKLIDKKMLTADEIIEFRKFIQSLNVDTELITQKK